jgi:hypothetical protein
MNRRNNELVTSIAEVLAEFDVMDLREGNPDIVDEYRPEAEDIAKRLQKTLRTRGSVSLSEIPELLAKVFEHWFEVEFDSAEFETPARRIHQLLSEGAAG